MDINESYAIENYNNIVKQINNKVKDIFLQNYQDIFNVNLTDFNQGLEIKNNETNKTVNFVQFDKKNNDFKITINNENVKKYKNILQNNNGNSLEQNVEIISKDICNEFDNLYRNDDIF